MIGCLSPARSPAIVGCQLPQLTRRRHQDGWIQAEELDSGLAPGAEESCGHGERHGCTSHFTRQDPDVGCWGASKNETEIQTKTPSTCDQTWAVIDQLLMKRWAGLCLRIEMHQSGSTRCRTSSPDLAPQEGFPALYHDRNDRVKRGRYARWSSCP